MELTCPGCGAELALEQPYPYHAGFGNQGFLYDDAGTTTLVWSSFDPAYEAIVGRVHPWALTPALQAQFEERLLPSPNGGRFRFSNPARCPSCSEAISDPIGDAIYYLVFPGSLECDRGPRDRTLRTVLMD